MSGTSLGSGGEGGGGEGRVGGEDEVVDDVDRPGIPRVEADEDVDGLVLRRETRRGWGWSCAARVDGDGVVREHGSEGRRVG